MAYATWQRGMKIFTLISSAEWYGRGRLDNLRNKYHVVARFVSSPPFVPLQSYARDLQTEITVLLSIDRSKLLLRYFSLIHIWKAHILSLEKSISLCHCGRKPRCTSRRKRRGVYLMWRDKRLKVKLYASEIFTGNDQMAQKDSNWWLNENMNVELPYSFTNTLKEWRLRWTLLIREIMQFLLISKLRHSREMWS